MDIVSATGMSGTSVLALACAIALLAAFVKGAIGFAMPMIMISGLASFLSPELALAGLMLPTLVTNVLQAFRDGWSEAIAAAKSIRLFLGVGAIGMIASAQLVTSIAPEVIFAAIGAPIVLFGFYQLAGFRLQIEHDHRRPLELALGGFAGIVGGISGVWGPPLVAYLTGLNTPKAEQVRIQGVAFGLGAVLLMATHLQTGVLNSATLPFSAILVLPALVGMWAGRRAHDRMNQKVFKTITLIVLIIAGLNLLRRGII